MVVADPHVYCAICTKKCHGEVLRARGYFYHTACFNCKECGKSLATVGFFYHNGEYYCTEDYHNLFGQTCHQCGKFIEGEAVSALGVTYHINCFTCGDCGVPFPPGAKVNYDGDDYVCDTCIKIRDEGPPQVTRTGLPPYVNGGDAVNDYVSEPIKEAPVQATEFIPPEEPPHILPEAPPVAEPSSESSCAGCGNEIKSGQALLALDKQWHLWCFTCHKCGRLLAGEYMGRDGVPYCEEDYQAEFGVSCAGCGGYITGKVLQAGENHYHPQCLRCAKCGQVSVEGEEMHLQGSEIWHPHCSEEYQKSLEEGAKDFPSPPSSSREELLTKAPSVSSQSSDFQEPKSVQQLYNQPDEIQAEKTRPLSRDLSYSSDSLSTPAYSAKPFTAQRGLPASVSVKFTPGQRPVVSTNEKLPNGDATDGVKSESPKFHAYLEEDKPRETSPHTTPPPRATPPSYTTPPLRTTPPSRTTPPARTTPPLRSTPPAHTTPPPRTTPPKVKEEEELIDPVISKPVSSGYQRERSSFSGSDSGSSSARPPPPARSTSHGWRSRFANGPQSPKSPQSPHSEFDGPPSSNAAITVNLRKEITTVDPAPKAANDYTYKRETTTTTTTTEGNRTQTRISISTRSSVKTDYNSVQEPPPSSAIPNVLLRRGPTKDTEREIKLQNRKSLPTFREDVIVPAVNDVQESAPITANDRQASHRRSLPSLDKIAAEQSRMDLPIYPYDAIKTSNYKMPKDLDRSRLEAHLSDEDFFKVFKMSKDKFYKMPAWRQADQKKKAFLF